MKVTANNTDVNLHCEKMGTLNRIWFAFSIFWRIVFKKGVCLADVDITAVGEPVETEPA